MKKLISIIAVCSMALTLFASCGKEAADDVTDALNLETQTTAAETTTEAEETTAAEDEKATEAASEEAETAEAETETTEESTTSKFKYGTLGKATGKSKIWANMVGTAYILFKNNEKPDANGMQGLVYEIWVAPYGDDASVWSYGTWDIDGNTLKMTPVNQSENGNIGVEVGSTQTFTANDGSFTIPITFEQGGKTNATLKMS
ncbi:MAG: hypothetical protein MJ121_06275 [Clostridia bacterium]|nr:hypothetical protein [Clostridia bacterium]